MIIGVPTEIKNNERRVGLTAAGVAELTAHGHQVLVQAGAGLGSGLDDAAYQAAGAEILDSPDLLWERAQTVVKVKEPVGPELQRLRADQVLFTYLHLAAAPELTAALLDAGTTAIAYETVTAGPTGRTLPLLAPMSRVAGRLAPLAGGAHLASPDGSGMLLGGVPGTRKARVAVVGGGVAGENAAVVAAGMGARVTVLDVDLERLAHIDAVHQGRIDTLASNALTLAEQVAEADLVIGSVLIPGAAAPKLVTREMVQAMRPGSVLVDIAIDQGGCFEGSRPTTHQNPTFVQDGAVHYCVTNMPGAVPQTSTAALTNATLPYLLRLADHGWQPALRADTGFARGLHTHAGALTQPAVAEALADELGHVHTADVADVLA
ncbi:alanine dehydrogenase [Micrococcus sp.]|uniref:alanine dehydrogenase n=1 Tax=Micrococcus sp. TaxID=1271 RepID=UPI002A9124E5|nr:alanine dehydrogenase [Micrococcus sp.]MDY6054754.1 alanine dehydrogenase [Micrococcus sp.]